MCPRLSWTTSRFTTCQMSGPPWMSRLERDPGAHVPRSSLWNKRMRTALPRKQRQSLRPKLRRRSVHGLGSPINRQVGTIKLKKTITNDIDGPLTRCATSRHNLNLLSTLRPRGCSNFEVTSRDAFPHHSTHRLQLSCASFVFPEKNSNCILFHLLPGCLLNL